MKTTLFAAAVLLAGTVFAADLFKAASPADFLQSKAVKKTAAGLSVTGKHITLYGKALLTPDFSKKYKVSAEVRVTGAPATSVLFGFIPQNAKGQAIAPVAINGVPKSFTTLAAAAKKGDKILKIKNGAAWRNSPYAVIAFGAKADNSDMPNNTFAAVKKGSIKKQGNVWVLELVKPLAKAYAAGTPVREQLYAGTYIYTARTTKIKMNTWTTLTGTISGKTKGVRSDHAFWQGTAQVRPLVLASGKDPKFTLEFRNFKVTEVK